MHANTTVHAGPLATLGRLDNATLHDLAYQRLAERIMAGAFQPGQALSMQRLADALGTSTTPVREALRRLATNGAVVIQTKRAVRIPRMTKSRFQEIGDIRVAMEGLAAAYAAKAIQPAELTALRAMNEKMNKALANHAVEEYLELNQAFHFGIYRAANAPVALSIIEGLWLQIGPVQGLYTEKAVQIGTTTHDSILEALQRRDDTIAADAMRTDIRIGMNLLAETSGFES